MFYTDTGGGYNAIAESIAPRYSLASGGVATSDDGEAALVEFPEFAERAGIPAPARDPWLGGHLVVVPDAELEVDGFLGSRWFAGGIWAFDYGSKTLSRVESADQYDTLTHASLGFCRDDSGARDLNFPRVTITVDERPLEMLLDTGATADLTEQSASIYGIPAGRRVGTSYMVRSVFDRWHTRHPA